MQFSQESKGFKKRVGAVIRKTLKMLGSLVFKLIILAIIIALIYLTVFLSINSKMAGNLKGTCIEADEFGSKNNIIRARPISDADYYINKSFKDDEFTQKIKPTDLNLALNGDPVTINIVGQWTKWPYNTNPNFICALEKYTLTGDKKFSNRAEENEFYFIRNFHSAVDVRREEETNSTVVTGIKEPPERQKECWITRGAGLYLASFGVNGKTEPTAYHHLIADKIICSKEHWFNGAAKSDNYVITDYTTRDSNGKAVKRQYTLADFKKNYFSVSYYNDLTDDDNSLTDVDKKVLVETDYQIIYNIGLHEDLLAQVSRNKEVDPGYAFRIAHSLTKFNQACYTITRNANNEKVRSYKSYYQFGPKILYSNASNYQNIKYGYGEKIKLLIVDKFYKENEGYYKIEIVSGIEFDEADYIESKIREIEFYLLGTPDRLDSSKNRSDGMVARIFRNILTNKFVRFTRAILALYVVVYGFRVIFGFKKDQNDRSVINQKDLMVTLFKVMVIVTITSPTAYTFFSQVVIRFVIDGTIGIIDLIASIFPNGFASDSLTSLTGSLQNPNNTMSLARNFAIVDEILNFFADKTIFTKAMAFSFNLSEMFGAGLIISIVLIMVLLYYAYKLLQSIIPFIFVLLQFTLVLPLAPLFVLFMLFKETSFLFQNWLKFIFSKCLELVAFFTAFYFCTSIIDNFIKTLLNYKVCFIGLGDFFWPETGGSGIKNWLVSRLKKMLNRYIAVKIEGSPISGVNFFIYYLINLFIVTALVFLFDIMTKEIMNIIGSVLTIDGATANVGGGAAVMSEGMGGKLSLDNQFKNFNTTMGIATIQKTSDQFGWTKGVVDLEKGIGANVMQNVRTVMRFSGNMVMAATNTISAGSKALANLVSGKERFDAKSDIKEAGRRAATGAQGLVSTLTSATWKEKDANGKEKTVRKSALGDAGMKFIDNWFADARNSESLMRKNLNELKEAASEINQYLNAKDEKDMEVSDLLNTEDNEEFRKLLKKRMVGKNNDRKNLKDIFSDEVNERLFSDDMDFDSLDDNTVDRMKNYLKIYKSRNNNRISMEYDDINYDVFSEDYGMRLGEGATANKRKSTLLNKIVNVGDDAEAMTKLLRETPTDVVEEVLGKNVAERVNSLRRAKNKDSRKNRKAENNEVLSDDEVFSIRKTTTKEMLKMSQNDGTNIQKIVRNTPPDIIDEVLGKKLGNELREELKDSGKIEDTSLRKVQKKIVTNELKEIKPEEEDIEPLKKTLKETPREIRKEILGEKLEVELDKKLNSTDPNDGIKVDDIKEIKKKVLTNELKEIDNTNDAKDLIQQTPPEIVDEVLGKDNANKLASIDPEDLTEIDIQNLRDHIKNKEKAELTGKPAKDVVEDIFSNDFGREKKFVLAEELNEVKDDKTEFINRIKKLENMDKETLMAVFGDEDKVNTIQDIIDNKTVDLDDAKYNDIKNSLNDFNANNNEININEDADGKLKVNFGQFEYNVEKKKGNDGKVSMVLIDQDGTVIMEAGDASSIINCGDTQFIISSGDMGTVINVKKSDGTEKTLTAKEKMAEVMAKVEAKMAKFDQMMKAVEEYEKNKAAGGTGGV